MNFIVMIFLIPIQKIHFFLRKKYLHKEARKIVRRIQQENILLAGIKLWAGDSFRWAIYIAKIIKKKCPETVIIAGGPLATVKADLVIEQNLFDIIIEGKNRGIWTFHDHDTRRVTNNGLYPGGNLMALVYEDLPMEERMVGQMAGMKMDMKDMKGNMLPKVALDE